MKKDLFKLILTAFLFCVMLCSVQYRFDEDKMFEMLFLSIFLLVFLLFTSNIVDCADKLYARLRDDLPDASTLRSLTASPSTLDKALLRDLRKAILSAAADGRHSVKFELRVDNPDGSGIIWDTKSVKDYLLSRSYHVKVDPKAGKFIIIRW